MKRINTGNWQKFQIKDLFVAKNTGNILSRDVADGSGNTPYVTASAYNNGVTAHIDASAYDIIPGHCILIGGKTFTMTYQKDDFVSNDSHNFEIHLVNNVYSDKVYFFLITAIRSSLRHRYEWSDAVTKEKLLEDYVYLPVTSDNEPDWVYMEEYITQKYREVNSTINNLEEAKKVKLKCCNSQNWRLYRLGELFDINKGKRLTKANMKPGNINYIGATAFNNGVTAIIGNSECLHPSGTITVCYNGSIGQSFYQKVPFWATDDVNVLYPKFPMTTNIALFIIPLLRKIGTQYAYKDKWTQDKMKETMLPLPSLFDKPDWDYMEKYIIKIKKRIQTNIKYFSNIGQETGTPWNNVQP